MKTLARSVVLLAIARCSAAQTTFPPLDEARVAQLINADETFVRGQADHRFVVAWDIPGIESPPERMKYLTRWIEEATRQHTAGFQDAYYEPAWPKLVTITGIRVNGETATAGADWYYVDTIAGFTTARPQHSIYYFKRSQKGWELDGSFPYACWRDNGDGRARPGSTQERSAKPLRPDDEAPVVAPEPDKGWLEQETLKVGGEVLPPKPLTQVKPEYSSASRRARLEGVVALQGIITPEGEVKNIHVFKSAGDQLDAAAIEAFSRCTYEPATFHGEPVTVYVTMASTFKLAP